MINHVKKKTGKTLAEIVEGKNYPFIEFRCRYQLKDGTKRDDFWGCCSYIDGILKPFDQDTYSLDFVYQDWAEWQDDNGETCLTVWEDVGMWEEL